MGEEFEELTMEELEQMEEVPFEIDESAFSVNESHCPACQQKMTKYIENRSLFDGTITFHIIKFKCEQCKKEYLDLEQAEKYSLFLRLEHLSQEQSLEYLNHCLSNGGRQKVTA